MLSDTSPRGIRPATQTSAASGRRWPRIILGWVVAALFVGLAFRRVSLGEMLGVLRSARGGPIVLALVALAAGFTVRIVRWWQMLRVLEPGLPLRACIRPFLVSIAVNNTLPLRAGDVVRAVGFRSALRASPMAIVGTLLVERLLDVVVLLALLFAGLAMLGGSVFPPPFLLAGIAVGVVAACGLLALVIVPTWLRSVAHHIVRRIPSSRWQARLGALVDQLFDSLAIVRPPRRTLALVSITALAWALEGTAYASVAWSLRADGSAFAPWFALSTGTLATMIPSSPGYVGTFDFFAVRGLTAFGTSQVVALGVALLVHLLLWLPVTIVGALFLVAPGGRRVSREVRPARAVSEAA
ncbi:MAG TPA: lysylphosphatidylglycerol synthase transmembrane domain-containing protein [Gemmatimonadaceae bacterium]|nr:lysylphosphatidylglycerol synthase transmembrane domain-containing protein [Gemmatimonadaceae bacterium]